MEFTARFPNGKDLQWAGEVPPAQGVQSLLRVDRLMRTVVVAGGAAAVFLRLVE